MLPRTPYDSPENHPMTHPKKMLCGAATFSSDLVCWLGSKGFESGHVLGYPKKKTKKNLLFLLLFLSENKQPVVRREVRQAGKDRTLRWSPHQYNNNTTDVWSALAQLVKC